MIDIFFSFAKIGAFTLGGGYAMVPLIQREVVEKKEWITKDEFVDILAIAQSTPGALAINMAAFIGYKRAGIFGAIMATLGSIIPSFLIILAIATFFERFMSFPVVERAFKGIRPAVAALIGYSVIKIAKTSKIKPLFYIISIIAFLAVQFVNIDPIIVILTAAFIGGVLVRGGKVDN